MSDINRIILSGNVGQEPEYKYFDSGAIITEFSLAVNRYDSKTKKDVTDWLNVKTFSKLGEYIKKGYKLALEGKLITDTWQTSEGEHRKKLYILADNLQILTSKEKETEQKNVSEPEKFDENIVQFTQEEIPF